MNDSTDFFGLFRGEEQNRSLIFSQMGIELNQIWGRSFRVLDYATPFLNAGDLKETDRKWGQISDFSSLKIRTGMREMSELIFSSFIIIIIIIIIHAFHRDASLETKLQGR